MTNVHKARVYLQTVVLQIVVKKVSWRKLRETNGHMH